MGPETGEALTEAFAPLRDRPPAPLGRRALARAIDAATVFFCLWTLVVLRVFWFMDELSETVDPQPWGRAFVATVSFVVLHAVYEVVFLTRNQGQTPGRDVMRVRVVPIGPDDVPNVGRALRRWFLPGVAALVPPVWLGALAVAAVGATAAGPGHRGLADRLGGTMVVPFDRDREDPSSVRPQRRRRRGRWEDDELVSHQGGR